MYVRVLEYMYVRVLGTYMLWHMYVRVFGYMHVRVLGHMYVVSSYSFTKYFTNSHSH